MFRPHVGSAVLRGARLRLLTSSPRKYIRAFTELPTYGGRGSGGSGHHTRCFVPTCKWKPPYIPSRGCWSVFSSNTIFDLTAGMDFYFYNTCRSKILTSKPEKARNHARTFKCAAYLVLVRTATNRKEKNTRYCCCTLCHGSTARPTLSGLY